MNYGSLIFLTAFLTLACSWAGLVLTPQLQLGRLAPVKQTAPNPDYPAARPGLAQAGLQVYRSLGCAECHTQQVRPERADLDRGWGKRRTVAQDFLTDTPVLVGALRAGPDLANLGLRAPEKFATPWKYQTASNHVEELEQRLYLQLYNPRQFGAASLMPAHRFLFEERPLKPGEIPGTRDLTLEPAGEKRQVVPKPAARALVAYLMSLRADATVFEAPLPKPAEKPGASNAAAAGMATNAAAAPSTNTAAQ
jgi:cytochrome c oxidase cbb3-type subunit 2